MIASIVAVFVFLCFTVCQVGPLVVPPKDCLNGTSPYFDHMMCGMERDGICSGNVSLVGILVITITILVSLAAIFITLSFTSLLVFVIFLIFMECGLKTILIAIISILASLYPTFVLAFYVSSFFTQYIGPIPIRDEKHISCHEIPTYDPRCQLLGFLFLILPVACLGICYTCVRDYHKEKVSEVNMYLVHVDR